MGVTLAFASGVYAFDPATGTQKWFQATTPTSGISAGGGLVYLIEGGSQLVARKQTDGTMAWSAAVDGRRDAGAGARRRPGDRRHRAGRLRLRRRRPARPPGRAPLAGAAAQAFDLMFSGGCVAGSGQWSGNEFGTAVPTTTLAAALGSGTLVVAAPDGVHVLSLSTGAGA